MHLLKLSEKSRRCLKSVASQGTKRHCSACSVPGIQPNTCSERYSNPFRTVSLGSTLAIWPYDTPHKVGILRRPLGLFAGRSGRPTRKKSPTENRGPVESHI